MKELVISGSLLLLYLVSHDVVWSSSDLIEHIGVAFWPALSAGLDEEVLVLLHVARLRLLAAALERDDVAELLSLLDEAGSGRVWAGSARSTAGSDGKRIAAVGGLILIIRRSEIRIVSLLGELSALF